MAIDQKISQLPTPPTSTDPANFRQRADEFVGALPQLTDEMNVAIDQINATESNINNKEQSATDAATTAMASANFIGEWDSATQYTHPCSVVKNGVYYVSLQDSIGQDPATTVGYWEVLKDQNNTLHKIGSGLPNEAYTKTEADNTFVKIDSGPAFLSTNGYQKLPSGLIIQWGDASATADSNSNATLIFPIAFPNACFQVVCIDVGSACADIGVLSMTTNNFTIHVKQANGNEWGANDIGTRFIAIGY